MSIKAIKIIPFKSVNEVDFGTNRKELWKKMGTPKDSFKKIIDDIVDTDDYEMFHIFYNDNYMFEAIEVFDELDIYYNNVKLPQKYSQLLKYFKSIYDDIEEDECGFISKIGSIGVYIENDEDRIDSILFGRKDYYNE